MVTVCECSGHMGLKSGRFCRLPEGRHDESLFCQVYDIIFYPTDTLMGTTMLDNHKIMLETHRIHVVVFFFTIGIKCRSDF